MFVMPMNFPASSDLLSGRQILRHAAGITCILTCCVAARSEGATPTKSLSAKNIRLDFLTVDDGLLTRQSAAAISHPDPAHPQASPAQAHPAVASELAGAPAAPVPTATPAPAAAPSVTPAPAAAPSVAPSPAAPPVVAASPSVAPSPAVVAPEASPAVAAQSEASPTPGAELKHRRHHAVAVTHRHRRTHHHEPVTHDEPAVAEQPHHHRSHNFVVRFVSWWNGWVERTFHTKIGTVPLGSADTES